MGTGRPTTQGTSSRRSAPATTPLAREQQLSSKAYDLAESQLDDGTASSQVITHFLKMGSTRELLEQDRMRNEIELMSAKKAHMEAMERQEELFAAALAAMTQYKGGRSDDIVGEALD
jgi:hypothetical protein